MKRYMLERKKLNVDRVNEIDKESVRKEVRDFLPRARKGGERQEARQGQRIMPRCE